MADFSWFLQESYEPTPGTPDVDIFEFNGLKIAMPDEIVAGAETAPLCGTWAMSFLERGRWPQISDCYVYIVRNLKTHVSHCGHFRYHADLVDGPDPPPNPRSVSAAEQESDRQRRAKGYFNIDLARVWKIPAEPGKYLLTVLLDEYQSNDFAFEIVEPQE